MKLNKVALIELAKSFGRFLWFGILGLVVAFLTSLVASGSLATAQVDILGQSINVGILIVGAVAFVAKAIDRYIHENDKIKLSGIAPGFLQK